MDLAKENGKQPAFPSESTELKPVKDGLHEFKTKPLPGLSKREYFAAMAMQAIASGVFALDPKSYLYQLEIWKAEYGGDMQVAEVISRDSVKMADALLKQLEATTQQQ